MANLIQTNKTVIITGANSGLGYCCAEAIARSHQDWHIIIASRNPSRVDEAVQRLINETGYPSIEGMTLDLASLTSVRQFVQDFTAGERPPLQAIICNAGIQIVSDTRYTEDGFEMTFGVNHLGHFLLVNLILPQMGARARIVFVSSDTHNPELKTGMPDPQYQDARLLAFPTHNDTDTTIGNKGRRRYTTSKLCNILCAYELSRRLQQHPLNITVNVFNPSLMLDTKLARDYSEDEIAALTTTLSQSAPESAKDPKAMGNALARLILDPSLAHTTGKYFDGLTETPSSNESYDQQKATELWESSAALVKLSPEEAAP